MSPPPSCLRAGTHVNLASGGMLAQALAMTDVMVVLTTFPDEVSAKEIARELVGDKLVACVNLLAGGVSIYEWNGELCEDREVIAIMKTSRQVLHELKRRLLARHSYEVPEFLALEVADGSDEYLNFIRKVKTC